MLRPRSPSSRCADHSSSFSCRALCCDRSPGCSGSGRLLALLLEPLVSFAVWIAVVAAWHMPAAYDYTLAHKTIHDLEHLSFILPSSSGCRSSTRHAGAGCASRSASATCSPSSREGRRSPACSSSPRLPYPFYAAQDERLFGVSPLRDEQLAGVVMVAEQLASFAVCAGFLLAAHLRPARPPRRRRTLARVDGVIATAPFGSTGHESTRTIFGAAALGRSRRRMPTHARAAARARRQPHRHRHFLRRLRAAHRVVDAREPGRFFLATKTGERGYEGARKRSAARSIASASTTST